jgi:hypothetical protein
VSNIHDRVIMSYERLACYMRHVPQPVGTGRRKPGHRAAQSLAETPGVGKDAGEEYRRNARTVIPADCCRSTSRMVIACPAAVLGARPRSLTIMIIVMFWCWAST